MNPNVGRPSTLRFVSADGKSLASCQYSDALGAGPLVALDASDVVYRVVESSVVDDECVAVVEVDYSAGSQRAEVPALAGRAEQQVVGSSDGVELALHHLGGSGPALLICHATGFHGLAYAPFARELADHFDVWAIDLRGHGASTAPASGDFAWTGMGDDVAAAVAATGAAEVFAVGHSLGGASIILAEMQNPGLFRSAYLFEPIVFPAAAIVARGDNNPMSGPARRRRPEFESRTAALERYASRPPLGLLRIDALAAYVQHGFVDTGDGQVRLACEPESEARTFEAEDKMTLERVTGLPLSALIAAGGDEPGPNPAAMAEPAARAIVGAEFRSHPELGHFGPLEDPTVIAAEVIDWMG